MHEFFAFELPATATPRHRTQWTDAVLASWRAIAEDTRTGAALIHVVRDKVTELEDLQRELFGTATSMHDVTCTGKQATEGYEVGSA